MKVGNAKLLTNLSSGAIICGFALNLIFGQSMIMTASCAISAGLNLTFIASRPGRIALLQICRDTLQIYTVDVRSERIATHFTQRLVRIISSALLLIWRLTFSEFLGLNGIVGGMLALGERIRQHKSRPRVIIPPLDKFDRIVRLFWSKSVCDRVFTPARADIVHEWRDAEIAGAVWRSRWIRYVRGPYSIGCHMLAQLPWDLLKTIAKLLR